MSENFDYNEIFMGVMEGKKKNYKISFEDEYRLKRLTEAVKLKSGRMLDMGCGGGLLTESLPYYFPKIKVFGYDVSKPAIAYAKKFGSGKVTYSTLNGKKLPYKDNFFDVCICLDVMEHIPDVDFFLKETKRILKKNGLFFLLIPCEGEPFTFTWLFQKIGIGDKLTYKHFGHIHPEFTHKSVIRLLQQHGFKIKKKTYSEHFFYQFVNLFTYFIPKEAMDFLLGKKAAKYYDRGIIEKNVEKKRKEDFFDKVRNTWLSIGKKIDRALLLEIEGLKHVPFTAWKIHILAQVDKN